MKDQQIIYLVDDDEDDRFFIRGAVEELIRQVKVLEFDNGVDFLQSLARAGQTQRSGLLLLDINMPQMSGMEVIAQLRSLPIYQQLPILVLSTAAHPQVIKDAIAMGASGYFVKPSSPSGLRQLATDIKEYWNSHC